MAATVTYLSFCSDDKGCACRACALEQLAAGYVSGYIRTRVQLAQLAERSELPIEEVLEEIEEYRKAVAAAWERIS